MEKSRVVVGSDAQLQCFKPVSRINNMDDFFFFFFINVCMNCAFQINYNNNVGSILISSLEFSVFF